MRRSLLTYKLRKTVAAAWLQRYGLQLPLRYVLTVVVVSACVQIVMLPLLVIHFHRVSPVALVLNLVVGVLMTGVTVSATFALLLGEASRALAMPFVFITQALNAVMVHSVDPFMTSAAASFRVPVYSGFGKSLYALYYVPLAVLLIALWNWRPVSRLLALRIAGARRWKELVAGLLLATLSVLILAHPRSDAAQESRLRIDFLDVGQGDAALITLPDNTTLLIDGGGRRAIVKSKNAGASDEDESGRGDENEAEYDRRTIGERIVSEYLWWRGLDRVDYLLATHADTDHIEGLNPVASNFRVRAALVAPMSAAHQRDPDFVEFMQTLAARRIPSHTIAAGDVLRLGGATLEVLHPPALGMKQSNSSNNNSVVIRLSYGKRRFLFTGDIERAGEMTLLRGNQERLAADVVKVAHHGSRTSSTNEFVRESHPALAVISVGRDSPFGHPHKEIVERWRASGARVLTTGESGTITVSTDGEDLRIETFTGEHKQTIAASETKS
jgi:competence protein ComEC